MLVPDHAEDWIVSYLSSKVSMLLDISGGGSGQVRDSQRMLHAQSSEESSPKSNGNFIFRETPH